MTTDAKWIIATLGVLLLASHALLTNQIDAVIERLHRAELERVRGVPRPVPSYTDGTTTFGSMATGPIEVKAPNGAVLTGTFEADLVTGQLAVYSDDPSAGRVIKEVDPSGFHLSAFEMTSRMLLELHGWSEERWPKGWSP